jgi:hypothetical protein
MIALNTLLQMLGHIVRRLRSKQATVNRVPDGRRKRAGTIGADFAW